MSVLKQILEYDLERLPEGSRLSVVITDFKIDVQLSAAQYCQTLDSILKLVASHPKGNAVRFAQGAQLRDRVYLWLLQKEQSWPHLFPNQLEYIQLGGGHSWCPRVYPELC